MARTMLILIIHERGILNASSEEYVKTYIPRYQNTAEFFFTHVQKTKKNVAFAKTLKSILITSMTIKTQPLFSFDQFECKSLNPHKDTSENETKKHVRNSKSENQTLFEREITSNSSLPPGEIQTPSQVTPW